MTPRSLFIIILKVIGLFFLKNAVEVVPQFISTLTYLFQPNDFKNGVYYLLGTTLIFAIYIFLTHQLLFKTSSILDKLELDKGFKEEYFNLNFSSSSILSIALITIGGLILTNEIPNLCKALYQYTQHKTIEDFTGNKPDLTYSVFTAAKVVIGIIIIKERNQIINFIQKGQKEE
ncbi:MAG: hypothetical protein KA797_05670 [Chitinophagales bacterium]|nr:hypothetical protein [Chitinophagales bacterium]